MPESAPPLESGRPAEDHEGALTPESIDRLLADFRAWLVEATLLENFTLPSSPVEAPPDLHTLLGQMIAVRQEVTLQTRAVRAQTEQNADALDQLAATVEELRRIPRAAAPQQSPDDVLRPVLKVLIDVYDALSLAFREAQRVEETVLPLLEAPPEVPDLAGVEAAPLTQGDRPFLARLFGVRGIDEKALAAWQAGARAAYEKAARECVAQVIEQGEQKRQGIERVRQLLTSLLAGYRMGLQRIERALAQNGLEPIPAVGEEFDPERMEVLEAAADTGRPAGEVLEEVRRGYLWRGRVFRYAQVRVARS